MPKIAVGNKTLKDSAEDPIWGEKLEKCRNMEIVEAALEE
jgi:hypothetical protein